MPVPVSQLSSKGVMSHFWGDRVNFFCNYGIFALAGIFISSQPRAEQVPWATAKTALTQKLCHFYFSCVSLCVPVFKSCQRPFSRPLMGFWPFWLLAASVKPKHCQGLAAQGGRVSSWAGADCSVPHESRFCLCQAGCWGGILDVLMGRLFRDRKSVV